MSVSKVNGHLAKASYCKSNRLSKRAPVNDGTIVWKLSHGNYMSY